MRQIDEKPGIHQKRDIDTVLRDGWLVPQLTVMGLTPRPETNLFGISCFQIGLRAQMHDAFITIDNCRIVVFGHRDNAFGLSDHGNTHRAGDDHHVARGRTVFQNHAAQRSRG